MTALVGSRRLPVSSSVSRHRDRTGLGASASMPLVRLMACVTDPLLNGFRASAGYLVVQRSTAARGSGDEWVANCMRDSCHVGRRCAVLLAYAPGMDPTVTAATIGVGGTVIVALAGFWANVRNTNKATALTLRALEITEQGQVAERYTKAIEQLGSENADVRIGGIYMLERIAKNSADDRRTIQFQLGAFVRNHARWPATEDQQHPTATVDEHLPLMQVRAPDIWAAVAVLSRRLPMKDEQPLYLSRVDLRGLRLDDARLPGVVMRHTNLARARLREAQLDQSDLKEADLRQADLEGTQLSRVTLSSAYLQGANLSRADLRGANLSRADLRGANLSDAILDNTTLTGARANDATIWPNGIDAERRRELGIIEMGQEGQARTSMP